MARGRKGNGKEPGKREAERRRMIVRAAIEVFAKKGYHGCRIADVAKEAGVAYGLVYHYFKNKDELLGSVFQAAWSGFVSRLGEVIERESTLAARVRGICQVTFDGYRVDPRGVRVLIVEVARSPSVGRTHRRTAFAEVLALAQMMFTEAHQKGELRPGLDPKLCGAILFGAVEMGLTTLALGLGEPLEGDAIERAKAQVADVILRGVLTPERDAEWRQDRAAAPRIQPATVHV